MQRDCDHQKTMCAALAVFHVGAKRTCGDFDAPLIIIFTWLTKTSIRPNDEDNQRCINIMVYCFRSVDKMQTKLIRSL